MFLAKVSANGQVAVPAPIRRLLQLGPGDKLLFVQNADGQVVISKAVSSALAAEAQDPYDLAKAHIGRFLTVLGLGVPRA